MVQLSVPKGDSGLVRENGGHFPLRLSREVSGRGFEDEDPQHTLFVLQGEVEPAAHLVGGQVLAEDGDEQPLGVGARILAVGQVERLPPAGGPFRPGHEVEETGILGVHRFLARDRPDVAVPLLVKAYRSTVEGEGLAGEIHDRLENPVEVEGPGDLPTDLEQHREIARPPLGPVELGVPDRGRRRRRETLQQLLILVVERPGAGALVHDLDGADGHPPDHHRARHDRGGDGVLDGIGGLLEPRIPHGLHDHCGPLLLRHIANEPGAHRHLGTHQSGGRPSDRQAAVQHVALGDPEGPAAGTHRRQNTVEDPGKQCVEIEGGVELEGDGVQ